MATATIEVPPPSAPPAAATSIADLAAATPSSRKRHIDALRALAITAVVLGHWLLMHVERVDGRLTGDTALPYLSDVHHLTWVFQVMPLFFLVGGYANAISWGKHSERGGDAASWMLERSRRVFPPLTIILLAIAAGALAGRLFGVYEPLLADVIAIVVLPLWFLVVYFAVIALTPTMLHLHQRFGVRVMLALLAVVVLGDVLRFATGNEYTAAASSVAGWFLIHQAGLAWQRGMFDRPLRGKRPLALLAGAFATLVALTWAGPYPVSMVSVPGQFMQNNQPPTLAMMTLAVAQLALALAVADPLERLMQRRWAWRAVIGINGVALTLFLWHMVAAFLGAVVFDAAGWLPTSTPGSGQWWLERIPWVGALLVIMAIIVATVGRTEARILAKKAALPRAGETRNGAVASFTVVFGAYLAAVAGMLWIASAGPGPHGPFMVPTGALFIVLTASFALAFSRRQADRRSLSR